MPYTSAYRRSTPAVTAAVDVRFDARAITLKAPPQCWILSARAPRAPSVHGAWPTRRRTGAAAEAAARVRRRRRPPRRRRRRTAAAAVAPARRAAAAGAGGGGGGGEGGGGRARAATLRQTHGGEDAQQRVRVLVRALAGDRHSAPFSGALGPWVSSEASRQRARGRSSAAAARAVAERVPVGTPTTRRARASTALAGQRG